MIAVVTAAAHAQISNGNPNQVAVNAARSQSSQHATVRFITEEAQPADRDGIALWSQAPIDYEAQERERELVEQIIKDEVRNEIKRTAMRTTQPIQKAVTQARVYNIGAPQISNSSCTSAITAAETKYGLPPHLLQAIAITESGQGGAPNPWAMNIQGQAHYASSAQEVIDIVKQYGSRSSIDIGCTQINLKWHGHRFADWRQLLDPAVNAEYAAFHLVELKKEFGGWSKAVSAYHSRTAWRGANYACKVSSNFGKIFGDNRSGCGPDIEILSSYLLQS